MKNKLFLSLLIVGSVFLAETMHAMEKETEETKSELQAKKRKRDETRQPNLQQLVTEQTKKQKLIFPNESSETRKAKSLLDRAEETVICYALNNIPQESGERLSKKSLYFGNNLLHEADNQADIQKLINVNINPNAENLDKQTVLNYYIMQGRLNAAHALLSIVGSKLKVHKPDIFGTTPLMNAIKQGDIELAQSIVHIIEQKKHTDGLNDYNKVGQTALTLSVRCMPALIELLIKKGANINLNVTNPIIDCITPLSTAIQYNPDLIESLIVDFGADVNLPDVYRSTPLMCAAQYNENAIKLLIDKGAKTENENDYQETALLIAAEYNSNSIEPLIQAGALVDFETSEHETALQRAAKTANIEALEKLLNNGAQINRANGNFTFALTAAIGISDEVPNDLDDVIKTVTYLLKMGARVNSIDLVRATHKPEILELLKKYIVSQQS
jgi:ankyrin repeat protein